MERAAALSRGTLLLPHMGDWMHEGQAPRRQPSLNPLGSDNVKTK